MQHTIRSVLDALNQALRRTARERGKKLNEVAIEASAAVLGLASGRKRHLNDIAGTWRKDPAFDSALDAQDTIDIDKEIWK